MSMDDPLFKRLLDEGEDIVRTADAIGDDIRELEAGFRYCSL